MNSYEPRLNALKQSTHMLDNKDLINDIDNFALKWSETYSLISRWPFSFLLLFILKAQNLGGVFFYLYLINIFLWWFYSKKKQFLFEKLLLLSIFYFFLKFTNYLCFICNIYLSFCLFICLCTVRN